MWMDDSNVTHEWTNPDLFTTAFFAYFLRFLASKYALQITIAKLRTERISIFYQFLSILVRFKMFFSA